MELMVKFRKSIMFFMRLAIMTSLIFSFVSVWYGMYEEAMFENKGNYVVTLSYVIILFTFVTLYGCLKIGNLRLHEVIYSFFLTVVITNFLMYLELSLIARKMLNPTAMIITTVCQTVIIILGCTSANTVYFKLYKAKQILAIFGSDRADRDIIKKMQRISERYDITRGVAADHHNTGDIKKEMDKYHAVLICDLEKPLKDELIAYAYATRKRMYILPSVEDIIINNSYHNQIFDTPVLICRNGGLSIEQNIVKRIMDLTVSGLGLLVAAPFMLVIAIAIKLGDGGPILFKQNRVTRNGKIFNVYKFRSMIVDADKDGAAKATDNDSRITKVGKVIRALRLDELPQLFNILKGDMSLVGPRPERTENVHEYTEMFPEFDFRHIVKGGLTGYAQVYGKYNTSPQDKVKMDLIYIENYSILLDIKLLVMTVKIMFMKESTEGFDESANDGIKAPNKSETEK